MARKAPTNSVIKRLFAKSGNRCAYKNCTNSLVDDVGNVLGEICHIEAASENGPRYNQNSDDEYRRSYDNLILLCERHHKIADNNPEKYTTEHLKQLKKAHQEVYSEANFNISNSILDKVIQKAQKQFVHINTNQGSGQQYILNADIINLDTSQNNKDHELNQPIKTSLKSRVDLITAILAIISLVLTILSRSTTILPTLNTHISSLLFLSTALFMILFGYLSWVRKYNREFKYVKKTRMLSMVIFFCIPIVSFILWFTFLRLTDVEIENRDKFIKLGNFYYDRDNLRNLALEPYRNAIKIDPNQPEITYRIKQLEE